MIFGPRDRFVLEVLQYRFSLGQAAVDVLSVGTNFAAETPFDFPLQGWEGLDQSPKQRRLALAVIAHNCGSRTVLDFQIDPSGDSMVAVTDGEVFATYGGSLARLNQRSSNRSASLFALHIFKLQPAKRFFFGLSSRCSAGASPVLVDKLLQLFAFGFVGGVDSLVVFAELLLIDEEVIDLARVHSQFPHRQI